MGAGPHVRPARVRVTRESFRFIAQVDGIRLGSSKQYPPAAGGTRRIPLFRVPEKQHPSLAMPKLILFKGIQRLEVLK